MTIVGVKPKVKRELVMKKCPQCEARSTVREKVDKKQILLNIPLYRVKKGGWIQMCDSCGWVQGNSTVVNNQHNYQLDYCLSCSSQIHGDLSHCPCCGVERV